MAISKILGSDVDIKPRCERRSYSNPECQGSLIRQTANWDSLSGSPGHSGSSAYIDRMWRWNGPRFHWMVEMMGGTPRQQCGIDSVVDKASEQQLIDAASYYFELDVVAVRWVYFFNVANGFPGERIDYIWRTI